MPSENKQGKTILKEHEKVREKIRPAIPVGPADKDVYPSSYGKAEATTLDQRIALIKQITGGKDPVINVTPDAEDFEILKRRGETSQQLAFDTWLDKRFQLHDPTANPFYFQMVKEHYPEFLSKKLAKVAEQDEVRQKESKLQLYGPQNMEDLFYMYMKDEDQEFSAWVKEATKGLTQKGIGYGENAGNDSLKRALRDGWGAKQQALARGMGIGLPAETPKPSSYWPSANI